MVGRQCARLCSGLLWALVIVGACSLYLVVSEVGLRNTYWAMIVPITGLTRITDSIRVGFSGPW
jgi:ABC-type glycerol-3-phosphate transport system permease component